MEKKKKERVDFLLVLNRIAYLVVFVGMLAAPLNPIRLSGLINKNSSLFTMAVSYSSISGNFTRPLNKGWVEAGTLQIMYFAAIVIVVGIVIAGIACCMSLGERKMKRVAALVSIAGSIVGMLGVLPLFPAYNALMQTVKPEKIEPMFATGIWYFLAVQAVNLVISLINWIRLPKAQPGDKMEMKSKYKLFLMMLPFVALVFIFSYLPLWGWRYAFYDYKPGIELSADNFVGFKWFRYLFGNAATRADIVRVITNTLAMSFLGIATSWVPMAFAIFLNEIRSTRGRRLVQTFTTIPNFISWVLVYSFAFALFSTDGFLNTMLHDLGLSDGTTNYLMSGDHMWLKMWAWGTWKGLGWNAIIYIAAISGIDQQLYEAATVDGAGRFRKMWNITVPGLLPTYFVLLLLSIAGILSNGMDQYYVFKNAMNKQTIEVLDLYVYMLGLGNGGSSNIPMATLVGMLKSIISVTLLFGANKISKMIRGESII